MFLMRTSSNIIIVKLRGEGDKLFENNLREKISFAC